MTDKITDNFENESYKKLFDMIESMIIDTDFVVGDKTFHYIEQNYSDALCWKIETAVFWLVIFSACSNQMKLSMFQIFYSIIYLMIKEGSKKSKRYAIKIFLLFDLETKRELYDNMPVDYQEFLIQQTEGIEL